MVKKLTDKQIEVFEYFDYFYNCHEDCLEKCEGFQLPHQIFDDDEIEEMYSTFLQRYNEKQKKKKTLKKKSQKKRSVSSHLCFVTDNVGHWYKIPVSEKQNFEDWLEITSHDKHEDSVEFNKCFDDYRCMHPVNYMFKEIEVLKESCQGD